MLALLCGVLGVFYFGLLSGKCYLWEDLLYMAHPAYNYLTTALADGRFPLWLPGMRCGIPLFSEPWVYYPPVWVMSLWVESGKLSSLTIQWFFISQLFLGGGFFYVFLRASRLNLWASFSGVVIFVLSGFMSLHFVHGGMLHAYIWLPLELFFVRRIVERQQPGRSYIYLILSIWMSFLAGFPQTVLYNAYFLGAYWLYLVFQAPRSTASSRWRITGAALLNCVKMAGVFLVVGLLGIFVILSTVQSWSFSSRQEYGFAQIADLSLPWYYLIHGLVPNFFGASTGDGGGVPFWGINKDTLEYATWHGGAWMYWEFGFYAGQLALIAVTVLLFNMRRVWAVRREAVFFLCALVPILWLMLGRYGGLFNVFYHVAPGFSMFRTPARLSGLLDFCLAVLVAVLVDWLMGRRKDEKTVESRLNLWPPMVLLAILYGAFLLWLLRFSSRVFPELKETVFSSHALNQTLLSLGLCIVTGVIIWRMGRAKTPRYLTLGAVMLALLAFLDLYLAFHRFHQGRQRPEDYFADRNGIIAKMESLRESAGPFRFSQLRDGKMSEEVIFPRNMGYLHAGYEAPEGYILFNLKDYNLFGAIKSEQVRLDIMNVGVMANADRATGQMSLIRYTNSLPRAKFYHDVRVYEDAKILCADLDAGRLDYHRTLGVLREDCAKYGVATSPPPANARASVQFIPKNSDEYQIQYQTTAPGVIFVSESFYPGWQADGGKYPVIHAFGAFKGIVIPEAGSGVITVKFSPGILWLGLAISGTTLLGLFIVWVWLGRKSEGKT